IPFQNIFSLFSYYFHWLIYIILVTFLLNLYKKLYMKSNLYYIVLVLFLSLQACKTTNKIESPLKNKQVVLNEVNFDPIFKAIGTEPFWNIQFDKDYIIYEDVNQQKIIFNTASNHKAQDANVRNIKGQTQDSTIDLTIIKQNCSDGMSDNEFDFKVKVEINHQNKIENLNGCGNFLIPEKLQGKWELNYFIDKDIPSNKYLKTPYIEFSDSTKQFSGNASCNGIKGRLYIEENIIRFDKIASTKMMCVHENMEKDFLAEL